MEVERKMKYIINKTKYMTVTTAKEKKKYQISEQVKAENIPRTIKYRYLRIHNNRNK